MLRQLWIVGAVCLVVKLCALGFPRVPWQQVTKPGRDKAVASKGYGFREIHTLSLLTPDRSAQRMVTTT